MRLARARDHILYKLNTLFKNKSRSTSEIGKDKKETTVISKLNIEKNLKIDFKNTQKIDEYNIRTCTLFHETIEIKCDETACNIVVHSTQMGTTYCAGASPHVKNCEALMRGSVEYLDKHEESRTSDQKRFLT